MSARRRAPLAALCALAATLALAAPAAAEVGSIQLVSKSGTEQATAASNPALSADGRYLVYQGTLGGLTGIFRRDLASGTTVSVATGLADEAAAGPGEPRDAREPSVSADGRYVSFTTDARLDPGDDRGEKSPDVYVADLASNPPGYELASARDGCAPGGATPCGLSYAGTGGSLAAGRVALSADGREVAFVTSAKSDLGQAVPGSTETPAGEVAVRDLDSDATTLVSVVRNHETGQMEAGVPVPEGGVLLPAGAGAVRSLGAALSADGSTVAWLGAHLPAQVPLLHDEEEAILKDDGTGEQRYDEPLWRRIADGPGAPTRRVVGGGDPLAPGCPPGGSLAEAACQGPFPQLATVNKVKNSDSGWIGIEGSVQGVPALSADGYTVAMIGNPVDAANLFVADMHPGVSRRAGVRQLTQQVPVRPGEESGVANAAQYIALNGTIFDLAISAGGSQIAFTTGRQQFPLSPPTLISQPPGSLGLVELYEANLASGTIARLTHGVASPTEASLGPGTAQLGEGATAPSLAEEGRLVGFASTASNLVEGDGNDNSDAFTVSNVEAPRFPGGASISTPPRGKRVKAQRRLRLSASSLADGSVRLVAVVPAPGRLRASAGAALVVGAAPRRLAGAARKARRAGAVEVKLALPARLRRLARTEEGLYAIARVEFRARKGKKLQARIQVRFHAHPRHGGGGKGPGR